MNEVVVTGCRSGHFHWDRGIDELLEGSLKAGKSGIPSVTRFDASDIASQVASEVTDFNPEDYMDPKGGSSE